jgi:hypothetical protein
MSKTNKIQTCVELVSEAMRESREPISLDEIVRRVGLLPGADSTISISAVCDALDECEPIVETGEEMYGWLKAKL